jgi:hypothetical protein
MVDVLMRLRLYVICSAFLRTTITRISVPSTMAHPLFLGTLGVRVGGPDSRG